MNEQEVKDQTRVLETGTANDCIKFALNVEGADMHLLQNRVLEIGSANECWYFARYAESADVPALEKRIAELEA